MSLIEVLRGQPTPEELAVVITVLQTRAISTPAPRPLAMKPLTSAWTDRAAAIALRRLPHRRPRSLTGAPF